MHPPARRVPAVSSSRPGGRPTAPFARVGSRTPGPQASRAAPTALPVSTLQTLLIVTVGGLAPAPPVRAVSTSTKTAPGLWPPAWGAQRASTARTAPARALLRRLGSTPARCQTRTTRVLRGPTPQALPSPAWSLARFARPATRVAAPGPCRARRVRRASMRTLSLATRTGAATATLAISRWIQAKLLAPLALPVGT